MTTGPLSTGSLSDLRVLVLGAGNMGGAFVTAMLAAGVPAGHVRIANSSAESSRRAADELGVEVGSSADVAEADVLVLGVKPYQLAEVLPPVSESLREETHVICLAAGTSLAALGDALGGHRRLVRALPNTPMAIGQGVTHLMPAPDAPRETVDLARALLAASGILVELPEEKSHALIGASGSGVAFLYTIIDAMVDEAVRQGIPRAEATRVVAQTVRGAACLIQETGVAPSIARAAVMSPGGTTAEGLAALEEHGIRPTMAAAMRAAAEKSRALSGD